MARRTVYFSGHVQGVGFRFATRQLAATFAVTGYVRNLPDGRVELVVEGPDDQMDGLVKAIGDRMSGYVNKVQQRPGRATGEFSRFEIRH